jgi:polygalacturonase
MRTRALLLAASLLVAPFALPGVAHAAASFNVKDYGAKGNGSTLDDDAIDKAITAASAASGGGVVVFPKGTYKSRSIHLKSNITVQLDTGATIRATSSGFDAPEPNAYGQYQDFGHSHFHNALLWGTGLTNVTFTGTGTIDGDGLVTDNAVPSGKGDKILSMTLCTNLVLRGITITRGGHFGVLLNGCNGVLLDSVKVLTTDDRDAVNLINTANVEVSHSDIEGDDDALSFKSDFALGRTFPSEHIRVHDSTIRSTKNNAIQFGVESCGDFRDAVFTNIGLTGAGKAGIGMVSLDGATISDIHFTGVTMARVSSPVFIRLGGRGSCPGKPPVGHITGVTISDVTGTNLTTPLPVQGAPEYASTIAGSTGADITDVSLTNVALTVPGGHPASDADLVPPDSAAYYRPREFGTRPAYGFWLRHATGVTFTNVRLGYDKADGRPAFAADGTSEVRIADSRVQRSTGPYDASLRGADGYAVTGTTTTVGDPLRIRS